MDQDYKVVHFAFHEYLIIKEENEQLLDQSRQLFQKFQNYQDQQKKSLIEAKLAVMINQIHLALVESFYENLATDYKVSVSYLIRCLNFSIIFPLLKYFNCLVQLLANYNHKIYKIIYQRYLILIIEEQDQLNSFYFGFLYYQMIHFSTLQFIQYKDQINAR
ncbi:unnamed protein product [Paramecium pentaurelia]|uniref:Uncharacterized protein n=1 Tax=Paramecium pentaurelia TaxID=43138 RepID=A0A8S1WY30_9CILI|nr:unnamed protein product [Paramecium pentaurelia]